MVKRILITASTFPSADTDPIPAFVKDQVVALKKQYPSLIITVLAPHDYLSSTQNYVKHDAYTERRFHYAWPHYFERLAGRGIIPTLKRYPLYYVLIPLFFMAEFFALLNQVRRFRPDIIYAHWFTPQGVVAGLVSIITRVPFVYTSHASDVDVWRKIPFIGKRVVHLFNKKASKISVVSRRSLAKLRFFFNDEEWKHVENKVAVMPMGVHIDNTYPQSKEGKGSLPPRNLLFIGRLAEKKGVAYLIEAFARFQISNPELRLVIAGDGPLLNTLKKQVVTLGLENKVEFKGYVGGQDKKDVIAESDLYIVPSIITDEGDAEGLPVVFMEGLAAGKLCIATNESGADDIIIDKQDGFLIPQKDVDALVSAIKHALALSSEERSKIQSNAKQKALQFSWVDIAKRHYEFLFSSE